MAELDASDQNARQLVAGLTAEQLNWQPAPSSWSVGQCLEHLCLGNETYLPSLSAALAKKRASAVEEITPGWVGRWFIRSFIEPSPVTKRASAPSKIVPNQHVELSVLNRFLRGNEALREFIRQASSYNVNQIRFRNPYVSVVRFTVGTGLEILSGHERRHLLQAQRVKQSQDFPG
jgi:hypothetical protein